MDNPPMLDLLWYVFFRWRVRPKQATGDTKYGTIENIKAIEDAHIWAYVPLPDWEHMTPYYGPAQFMYDAAHDLYHCRKAATLASVSERTESGESRVSCRPSHLQCLSSRSAMYGERPRLATASFFI